MTHSQVLSFPSNCKLLPEIRLLCCILASQNSHPELIEALENVGSRLALSAPSGRQRRCFVPCASFHHVRY